MNIFVPNFRFLAYTYLEIWSAGNIDIGKSYVFLRAYKINWRQRENVAGFPNYGKKIDFSQIKFLHS